MVEHETFNLVAVGSSPTGLTIQTNALRDGACAAPQRFPRPSPETATLRRRSPRGTCASWTVAIPHRGQKTQHGGAGHPAEPSQSRAPSSHSSAIRRATEQHPSRVAQARPPNGGCWPETERPLWGAQRQQADIRSWELPAAVVDLCGRSERHSHETWAISHQSMCPLILRFSTEGDGSAQVRKA